MQVVEASVKTIQASCVTLNTAREMLKQQVAKLLPPYYALLWDYEDDYPYEEIYPTEAMYKEAVRIVKEQNNV